MKNTLTQRDRILQLLKERGPSGVKVYELMAPRPEGLGIAQYNARIKELRSRGHRIVNIEPGHFVLKGASGVYQKTKPAKLDPIAKEKWNQMGAFLRGEGPKPASQVTIESQIQEALL